MDSNLATQPEPRRVLATALVSAGKELGLTQAELGAVIGRDRTALSRGQLAPDSKSGELALLLIRAYRALFALVGGDRAVMRHWMHTDNAHTGGVPAEQIRSIQGLTRVVDYLDAMRGKT
jgi:Antitoxin Xre/MbcA/ParS C-terminal toxin-binding domain/Antitoxin Xre-like helix-turn-helix domain